MTEFIDLFDENKRKEIDDKTSLQVNIVKMLTYVQTNVKRKRYANI